MFWQCAVFQPVWGRRRNRLFWFERSWKVSDVRVHSSLWIPLIHFESIVEEHADTCRDAHCWHRPRQVHNWQFKFTDGLFKKYTALVSGSDGSNPLLHWSDDQQMWCYSSWMESQRFSLGLEVLHGKSQFSIGLYAEVVYVTMPTETDVPA